MNILNDPENFKLSYHEAGHAVAAVLLGHKFKDVVLGNGNGHLGITNGAILNKPQEYKKNVKELVQIFSAGQAADEILQEKALPFRSQPDLDVITEAMRSNQLNAKDIEKIYGETKAMLKENWQAVHTVAQGLRDHNILTFDQVKRVLGS